MHTLLTLPYAAAETKVNTALLSTLMHTQQILRTTALLLIACTQHRPWAQAHGPGLGRLLLKTRPKSPCGLRLGQTWCR
jgi:hypothetical protein